MLGKLDYIEWTQGITLSELPELLQGLGDSADQLPGPLASVYEASIHGKEAELLEVLAALAKCPQSMYSLSTV